MTYNAEQISILEGLEAVRKRPGMYIGSTSTHGLHHIIWEIIDNSVDEALAGSCDQIDVTLDREGWVEVRDNGRGIPTGIHSKTGESALDAVFTKLHAGGKFGSGAYAVSGGLHGVGASVTNALSEHLFCEVKREGHVWSVEYAKGKAKKKVTKGRKLKRGEGTGTYVKFLYDKGIFDRDAHYDPHLIEQRLRERAYLIRGLKFTFTGPDGVTHTYYSQAGLADMIRELNSERKPVHPQILFFSTDDNDEEYDIPVDVALQWTQHSGEHIYPFANMISTVDGGTHVTGLKLALTRAMNSYAYAENKLKKDKNESFEGRDVFDGLTAVISVKITDPQYEGQTKTKLNNTEARTATTTFVYKAFTEWLDNPKNSKIAKSILSACLESRTLRLKKGQIKKTSYAANSIFADTGLPGKLDDCQDVRPPMERELFIVEGDSAAGSSTAARDNVYQAVMPIRGKIINVLGAADSKSFANAEIEAILSALGGSKDVVGRRIVAQLEEADLRYGKIVALTDADTDGGHISALLLTMFHELFPQLIKNGRIYVAKPPLYRIRLDSKGEKFVFAYSDSERNQLLKKHKRSGEDVDRFKGLGEMPAEALAETCFDPATRRLMQVTIEDTARAQETLNMLLGSRPELRKEWLESVGMEL
jgi:DNA gyrase subunit B